MALIDFLLGTAGGRLSRQETTRQALSTDLEVKVLRLGK